MKPHSYTDKSKLPYSLLRDTVTGRAAAYTNNHRLITPEASVRLVAHALAHVSRRAPFDPTAHVQGAPQWRPLPDWASDEVLTRCEILWIKHPDAEDDAAWRAIPKS